MAVLLLSLYFMANFVFIHGLSCRNDVRETEVTCGAIGDDVILTCNIHSDCNKVQYWLWKKDITSTYEKLYVDECIVCEENYNITNKRAESILTIFNMSEDLEGIYQCECGHRLNMTGPSSTTLSCFDVKLITDSKLNFTRNGVTEIVTRNEPVFNVDINDRVTINCPGDNLTSESSCFQLDVNIPMVVNEYSDNCTITCNLVPEECSISITLVLTSTTVEMSTLLNATTEQRIVITTSTSEQPVANTKTANGNLSAGNNMTEKTPVKTPSFNTVLLLIAVSCVGTIFVAGVIIIAIMKSRSTTKPHHSASSDQTSAENDVRQKACVTSINLNETFNSNGVPMEPNEARSKEDVFTGQKSADGHRRPKEASSTYFPSDGEGHGHLEAGFSSDHEEWVNPIYASADNDVPLKNIPSSEKTNKGLNTHGDIVSPSHYEACGEVGTVSLNLKGHVRLYEVVD